MGQRGIYAAVATNGWVLAEKMLERAVKLGLRYVEVSVDSVNPSKHDEFSGVPELLGEGCEGSRECRGAGCKRGYGGDANKG